MEGRAVPPGEAEKRPRSSHGQRWLLASREQEKPTTLHRQPTCTHQDVVCSAPRAPETQQLRLCGARPRPGNAGTDTGLPPEPGLAETPPRHSWGRSQPGRSCAAGCPVTAARLHAATSPVLFPSTRLPHRELGLSPDWSTHIPSNTVATIPVTTVYLKQDSPGDTL